MLANGSVYRIHRPTLAIDSPESRRIPVTVPAGALIKIVAENGHGDRFVDVGWEGRVVMMFKADVQARGELVSAAAGSRL